MASSHSMLVLGFSVGHPYELFDNVTALGLHMSK